MMGERKATTTGRVKDLDKSFGSGRGTVLLDFFRTKLAPVPGMAVDLFSGRTVIGDKIIFDFGKDARRNEIKIEEYMKDHLLPLTFTGVQEAVKDQGLQALATVAIPSIFGVGTQTYKK